MSSPADGTTRARPRAGSTASTLPPRARSRSRSRASSCASSHSSSSSASGSSGSSSSSSSSPAGIAPPLDVRWLHAGAAHLDLPANPITGAPSGYAAFSAVESARLEAAWERLDARAQRACREKGGRGEGESSGKDKGKGKGKDKDGDKGKDGDGDGAAHGDVELEVGNGNAEGNAEHAAGTSSSSSSIRDVPLPGQKRATTRVSGAERDELEHRAVLRQPRGAGAGGGAGGGARGRRDPVVEDLETVVGVPVSQDGLFEVDLASMSLHPVFWAHTGPRVPVIRATWFVGDVTHPAEWELADELERGYREIKPYDPSYSDELRQALEQGAAAEEKLRVQLTPGVAAKHAGGVGASVVYRDKDCGEVISSGMTSYLSKIFWSTLRAKSTGTMVYRGYAAALAASSASAKAASTASETKSRSRRDSASSARSGESRPGSRRQSALGGERPKIKGQGARLEDVFVSDTPDKGEKMVRSASDGSEPGGASAPKAAHDARAFGRHLKDDVKRAGDELRERLEKNLKRDKTDALAEETVPLTAEEEGAEECTDLILVIHGIGQQLATQYEGFNFVYAANILRSVMKQQSTNPALASIIRDRRVQVLPIQWRASLQLDQPENEEDVAHGMDNRFTMADITLPKIPVIRQLTNSVLLDIPLFMSHHRQAMIEAVCYQANRAYRLWCARNPNFDGKGRVHLIGHSLGSALAAHILSNQPTRMPPLSQLPKSVIATTKNQFLFNTSNLFFCGSPLGIFLHLDQAQLMPRRGRERTMHSPQDEALDRAGRFGCLSCDSVYNIIHLSDPIAYTLNATVDAKLAKKRPPLPITSVTAPFYSTVTEKLPAISQYLPPLPYFSSASPAKGTAESKTAKKPSLLRLPSGIEMSGPEGEERLQGSRAERRLNALNPHGNIDFVLPSGGVSEYLDALTSHASYWSDPNFGAFLLAEIFAKKLDMLRTGMGLANPGMVPEDIPL